MSSNENSREADLVDEQDADAFEDHTAEETALQDLDDADPLAPLKPPFPDDS